MNNYIKEKEILLEQSKNYLMALADIGAPPLLIMAILNIRERAATANAQEWKKENTGARFFRKISVPFS